MDGLILEVLEPDERAPLRLKLESFPVTIGRALDNTVVLDDPEVSAHHACIERSADGKLVLRDNQSANGLFDLRSGKRVSELALEAREKVRLGATTIRVRRACEPLERTVISRISARADHPLLRRRWLAPLLALGAAAVLGVDQYFGSYQYVEPAPLVMAALSMLIAIAGWAGAWGLVSRQLRRRFHFPEHCSAASIGIICLALLSRAEAFLCFSFPGDWPVKAVDAVAAALLLGWVFYQHLSYCSPWSARRLKVLAAAVAGVLIGTSTLHDVANAPKFRPQPNFPASMEPPSFRLAASESMGEFFEEARQLGPRADEAARSE